MPQTNPAKPERLTISVGCVGRWNWFQTAPGLETRIRGICWPERIPATLYATEYSLEEAEPHGKTEFEVKTWI